MNFDNTGATGHNIERLKKITGMKTDVEVLKAGLCALERENKAKDEFGFRVDDLSTLRAATAGIRSFAGHQGGSTMADWGDRLADFTDRYALRVREHVDA